MEVCGSRLLVNYFLCNRLNLLSTLMEFSHQNLSFNVQKGEICVMIWNLIIDEVVMLFQFFQKLGTRTGGIIRSSFEEREKSVKGR